MGPFAQAIDVPRLCLKAINAYKKIAYPSNPSAFSGKLEMQDGSALVIEEYLDSGRASIVVRLHKRANINLPVIGKFARREKYFQDIEAEWDLHQKHDGTFDGRVLPILERIKSKDGSSVLLKPYVKGNSLNSLIQSKNLNNVQLESLKQLIAWAEVFHQKNGISLDINPLNFVWVEDPKILKVMNLSEPSFVFYEITPRGSMLDNKIYKWFFTKVKSYKNVNDINLEDFPMPEPIMALDF